MRKIVLGIATATAIVASPAAARDGAWYAGVDLGYIFPEDDEYEVTATGDEIAVDYDKGWDGDIVVGYDFGMVRLEAEGGYKTFDIDTLVVPASAGIPGATFAPVSGTFTPDSDVTVLSSMLNVLADFGGNSGIGVSLGLGAGVAGVDTEVSVNSAGPGFFDTEDLAFAWQGLVGVRVPLSDSMEIGVKYRYFNVGDLELVSSAAREYDQSLTTHSLLGSLLFNFGGAAPPPPPPVVAPPPPPPPPPPPVQTRTCPDGSVRPVTQACPVPPPPVVAPTPERG